MTQTTITPLLLAAAISGGLSGAAAGDANQRAVVMRCMSGRGYQVLQ